MPWIEPDKKEIEDQYLASKEILDRELLAREVVLVGGDARVDDYKFDFKDGRFYVQLNHHLTRRKQPCDWLIARAGCGMTPERLSLLPDGVKSRVKVVSTSVNKHMFPEWQRHYPVFPFHELRHLKLNPFHPCVEWCNQFWNDIKVNPFVGMLALRMILLFPIKSVELIGFDFYARGGEVPSKISCHYISPQLNWLKNLYRTDFRVILSSELQQIIGVTEHERKTPAAFLVE
jgi:hypothetical protein